MMLSQKLMRWLKLEIEISQIMSQRCPVYILTGREILHGLGHFAPKRQNAPEEMFAKRRNKHGHCWHNVCVGDCAAG